MSRALPRLDLDFRLARASSWAGVVLFVAALGFAGDCAFSYFELKVSLEQKEARLAKLAPRASQSGDTGSRARLSRTIAPEEWAAAKDSLRQLSMPWTKLFQALESADSANSAAGEGGGRRIALLAIEPEPDAGSVRITGEAADYLAVLNYVLDLRRAGTLADVTLVHHETPSGAQTQRVAFSISASWGAAKP